MRSLVGGVLGLAITFVGLWMLSRFGSFGAPPWPFMVVWAIVGLGGAAAAFYNAFSKRGLPLYEVDTDADTAEFCSRCGQPNGPQDQFCRHCGVSV
jgi:ribosomal protein S27AE